ncbi:hypothetical protein NDU88_004357 [Pleurodeles waltl]|uniref:Uncharacterized protein n=1 Tax=Pleurodeles waltl TaxID=8319 RepID=A0AAV7UET9_PLEWA|nr:hypothetical protein NDU88_004357 [Pleurodeles waltl]
MGSIDGTDISGWNGATLKWDYSGNRLSFLENDAKGVLPSKAYRGENSLTVPISKTASTDAEMLQFINGTVMELQTETRTESQRAWMATKQLQVTVRKVAKTCGEIEEKLNAMENRTSAVEAEVEVLKEQVETQRGQLTDIMSKIEDFSPAEKK